MLIQTVSKKVKAASYNFALDTGAIATYNTGIFIPANATISRFEVKVITAPLSGGAATIQWDLGANPLMVPTAFGAFVINTVVPGVDFNANPVVNVAGTQVTMGIAGAVLTAGFFIGTIEYYEYLV